MKASIDPWNVKEVKDYDKLINEIEKRFNIKAIEVKRPRLNNHFYICSKKFQKFLIHNVEYDLPWQPLNKEEIENLSKGWKI